MQHHQNDFQGYYQPEFKNSLVMMEQDAEAFRERIQHDVIDHNMPRMSFIDGDHINMYQEPGHYEGSP